MKLLYKIRHVVEVRGYHEANKYLKDGYVLLSVAANSDGFIYCLGSTDPTKTV